HVERHVAKRPELTRPAAPRRVREQILEVPTPATISTEPDAEIAHLDGDVGRESRVGHHSSFSTGRSRRRNTNTPRARNASDIAAPTTTASVSHTSGKSPTRYRVKIPDSGLKTARVGKIPGR